MSRERDDWDDRGRGRDEYDDRGGRRDDYRDDYDDRGGGGGGGGRAKSGAVTAMGIIHIIFGSIGVLIGLCMLIGGVALSGAAADAGRFGAPGAGAASGIGAMVIIMALGVMIGGGAGITGGIGTLMRAFWGWVLGLVAGGLGGIMAILFMIGMIQAFGIPSFVPGKTSAILLNLLGFLVTAAYCTLVFVFSFRESYRRDFR